MARYSEVATSDEAVLIETDDFAIVFNKSSQKFYIKWWDATASTWETRAQIDAADALQEVLPALTDDLKFNFGKTNRYALRYNSTNDTWVLSDEVNAVDILEIGRNGVIRTIKTLADDLEIGFGSDNDYSLRYNSSNDSWVLKDVTNNADILEIRRNGLITVIGNLNDDLELPFGADKDFTARYDATNDDFRIKDAINAIDLFRLKKNTVVGYTVPVAPQDCINQTGLAADSTGVKFTSVVKTKVDARYLKKIRLRASWTASNTDSVTEVRVVGTTTGTIASVSGNTGSDAEAEGTSFSDGELVYIEVAVTTASATTGATTDLTYAIIEFIYEMV